MRTFSLLLLFSFLLGGLAQAQQRIVFLDFERAFESYEQRKSADQNLKAKLQEFEREKEPHVRDYKALDEKYKRVREDARNPIFSREKQDAAAAEGERILLKRREIESTIRQLESDRKDQLEQTMRRIQKRLVEDIQEVVRNHAKSRGYAAVLDKGARGLTGVPSVVYVDPTVDITDDIIRLLNAPR